MTIARTYHKQNGLGWHEWVQDGIRMIELTGEGFLTDEAAARFRAEFLGSESWYGVVNDLRAQGKLVEDHPNRAQLTGYNKPFELLIEEDCNIYVPPEEDIFGMFGSDKSEEEELADRLFLVFRKDALDRDLCTKAWEGLRKAARPSKNRGVAGGKVDPAKFSRDVARIIPVGDGTRARYVTKDGIVSDTVEANTTMGGIAGYFPKTARHPYCRATAYTQSHWDLFQRSWPFLAGMDRLFEQLNPIRYQNQLDFIAQNQLDVNGWIIPDTVYSTITVNKNFQTACHQDAGDLKSGFENFAVLEGGRHGYTGGETVFPKFRVGFNARTGDWVGMDIAHHWHGNMEILPEAEGLDDFERVSLVLYVRGDLAGAGTQEQEKTKYARWKKKHRNPTEQHKFRAARHAKNQSEGDFLMDVATD